MTYAPIFIIGAILLVYQLASGKDSIFDYKTASAKTEQKADFGKKVSGPSQPAAMERESENHASDLTD